MYKERIQELLKAQDGDPDMLEFVESRVNTMIDYVQYVRFMEVRMQRIQIEGLIGEEWRDAMESLDHNRHSKHEVAIAAVNQLNRLSAAGGWNHSTTSLRTMSTGMTLGTCARQSWTNILPDATRRS